MGGAKSMLYSPTGWGPDKNVCGVCAYDEGLKDFIESKGIHGKCGYCDATSIKVLEFDELCQHVEASLWSVYVSLEESNNPYDKEEGRYWHPILDTQEILEEWEVGYEKFELTEDLANSINTEQWCDRPPEDLGDGRFLMSWTSFIHEVTYNTRFTFLKPTEEQMQDHWDDELSIVSMLDNMIEISNKYLKISKLKTSDIVYRAREFKNTRKFSLSTNSLSPPPKFVCAQHSNRMSPAGISMFYGSKRLETAVKEISPVNPKLVGIGEFQGSRDLNLLDFSSLPKLPSIFDERHYQDRENIATLHRFVRELAKPTSDDKLTHVEYVPTQIVCEYFKKYFKVNEFYLDGLIYPSTADPGSHSLVLFIERDQVEGLSDKTYIKKKLKMIKSYALKESKIFEMTNRQFLLGAISLRLKGSLKSPNSC